MNLHDSIDYDQIVFTLLCFLVETECCCWPLLDLHSEDEDPEYKPLRMPFKDDLDDFTNSPLDDKEDVVEGEAEGDNFLI